MAILSSTICPSVIKYFTESNTLNGLQLAYTVAYKKTDGGSRESSNCISTECVITVSAAGDPGTEITVYVKAEIGGRTSNEASANGNTGIHILFTITVGNQT